MSSAHHSDAYPLDLSRRQTYPTSTADRCDTAVQHDSDVWETVAGWMWACRTCLDRGPAVSETDAREQRARHDLKPIPWWVERINGSQP